uniref:redoxin domain-containing protein n=2 Tax=Flavobacterium sp. TaxID=239 RepID=UPI00404913F9
MKNLILALMAITILVGCQKAANEFTITGTTDFADGTRLILSKQDEKDQTTGMKNIDTMVVQNGKFELKGSVDTLDLYYLKVENTNAMTFFVLENAKIEANIYKDSIQASVFTGTKNNEAVKLFVTGMKKVQNEIMNFQTVNNDVMQKAVEAQDSITQERLRAEYMALRDKVDSFQMDFAADNSDALFGAIILSEMINNPEIDSKRMGEVFNSLSKPLQESKYGKKVSEALEKLSKVEVGQIAPDFTAKSPEGTAVNLMKNLGSKVTIIDFWASWCRPCRVENPNMVKLYNDYKDQGLAMIGVSLDQDGQGQAWKDAIMQDNLTWMHVSNLKYWQDPIAVLYNVKSIPAIFILDADGKIVAKNIRGEELRAKVAELVQ